MPEEKPLHNHKQDHSQKPQQINDEKQRIQMENI